MTIHHLNCGTMRPFGGRLVSGTGPVLATAELVCHCLLVEADHGLRRRSRPGRRWSAPATRAGCGRTGRSG
jgi:hypothetical protein